MVFIKLKRGSLARQSKASSHQCLGKPLCQGSNTTKHALTYTMVEISALLTTGCCCNTACGIRQHTQLQQRTKKQSRTGWQGIRWSSQLLWNSCLDRKLCCMSLCWPSPDRCQRHSGTELLAPWAAGPTQQVFLNRKQKSHSANFLHFCSFSNIRAKPVQADVHGEGGPVAGSQLHQHKRRGSFIHQPVLRLEYIFIRGTAQAYSPMQGLTGGLHLFHGDSRQVRWDFKQNPLVTNQSTENPWQKNYPAKKCLLLGSRPWVWFPTGSWKLLL